ncbi:Chromobox protein 1 [Nowakowskiella sp. JEL0407]|nr:Chromobox protein 1 [Nowakowskiella sp. JEL0407]
MASDSDDEMESFAPPRPGSVLAIKKQKEASSTIKTPSKKSAVNSSPAKNKSSTTKRESSPKKKPIKHPSPTLTDDEEENDDNGEKQNRKEEQYSESGDDEVFEVEAIRAHRVRHGEDEYLIKWVGYSEKENTWEKTENILDKSLIDEFYEKQNKESKSAKRASQPEDPETTTTPKKTKLKKSDSPVKNLKKGVEYVTVNESEYLSSIPKNLSSLENWDDRVEVEFVRPVTLDENGKGSTELFVFLKWDSGEQTTHPAKVANKKCPQQIIKFYEKHLTFKENS